MPVAAESDDIRTVVISDTSTCSPKLTITPSALNIVVGAPATSFDLTAPTETCAHVVQINVSGSTPSVTSEPVLVLDKAIVEVGLFTTSGAVTTTVVQDGSVNIRFTSPSDWEEVTAVQSYSVSTVPSGVTFSNNPCSLTPGSSTS